MTLVYKIKEEIDLPKKNKRKYFDKKKIILAIDNSTVGYVSYTNYNYLNIKKHQLLYDKYCGANELIIFLEYTYAIVYPFIDYYVPKLDKEMKRFWQFNKKTPKAGPTYV